MYVWEVFFLVRMNGKLGGETFTLSHARTFQAKENNLEVCAWHMLSLLKRESSLFACFYVADCTHAHDGATEKQFRIENLT